MTRDKCGYSEKTTRSAIALEMPQFPAVGKRRVLAAKVSQPFAIRAIYYI
jgi:hypothetical protein